MRDQIAAIIETRYNGYRGNKMKRLKAIHSLIRSKQSDEEFLKFLQKMDKENPKPKYLIPTKATNNQ